MARRQQEPPKGPRLMEREGYLFIMSEYAKDEPGVIGQYWYPIGIRAYDFSRNYYEEGVPSEGVPARSIGAGEYEVNLGGFRPVRIRLKDGGKTQAQYVEQRMVPPPKVRETVDVQWSGSRGIWEKASKSTKWAWVPANPGRAPNPTEPGVTEAELTRRLKF